MHLNSAEGEERPWEKNPKEAYCHSYDYDCCPCLCCQEFDAYSMCIVSGFTNEDLISVTIPILRMRKLRPKGHLKGHLCSWDSHPGPLELAPTFNHCSKQWHIKHTGHSVWIIFVISHMLKLFSPIIWK